MTTPTPTPELQPLDDDALDRLFERLQTSDEPTEEAPDETPPPQPADENTAV